MSTVPVSRRDLHFLKRSADELAAALADLHAVDVLTESGLRAHGVIRLARGMAKNVQERAGELAQQEK